MMNIFESMMTSGKTKSISKTSSKAKRTSSTYSKSESSIEMVDLLSAEEDSCEDNMSDVSQKETKAEAKSSAEVTQESPAAKRTNLKPNFKSVAEWCKSYFQA